MMKPLPTGIQDLQEIVEGGYLYVDKTEYVHRLITSGKYYFLSRPRRFGKSLLVSTLKKIFEGNRDLFAGLWIHDKIAWERHPVIHIDFSRIDYRSMGLEQALELYVDDVAARHEIGLKAPTLKTKFIELIEAMATDNKVALLIDEYDKPIIDYLDSPEMVAEHRAILKNFYACIKPLDASLRLVFITGVSKFSQVSIFSDLNNLTDITTDATYASMCGYTEEEMNLYFRAYMPELIERYKDVYLDIDTQIRQWYNGYSWDGVQTVYNPFSILRLFQSKHFGNYWYSTGTPTFLLKLLRSREYPADQLYGTMISQDLLDKYDVTDIDIPVLLFQTGYLTIKEWDLRRRMIRLVHPNQEVAAAFGEHILAEYSGRSPSSNSGLLTDMTASLEGDDLPTFIDLLKTLMAGVTYQQIENKESYYHSIVYLMLKMIGLDIDCEILTNRGRIDAVITTETHVYVIEFKLDKAQAALDQIRSMGYHEKYMNQGKQVALLGIGFDTEARNIGGFVLETVL